MPSIQTFLPDEEDAQHISRRLSFNAVTVDVTGGPAAPAAQYATTPTYLPEEPAAGRSSDATSIGEVRSRLTVGRAIDIYSSGADTPVLGRVTRLLDEAAEHIALAIAALLDGRAHHADAEVQLLHGSLPELFCYRKLGDGFGMIIGSILIGLHNNAGDALSMAQMSAISNAIDLVREQPFISPVEAVDATMALEDAGMTVTTGISTAVSSLEPHEEGFS